MQNWQKIDHFIITSWWTLPTFPVIININLNNKENNMASGLTWMSILRLAVVECIKLLSSYLTKRGRESIRQKKRQKEKDKSESGSTK